MILVIGQKRKLPVVLYELSGINSYRNIITLKTCRFRNNPGPADREKDRGRPDLNYVSKS